MSDGGEMVQSFFIGQRVRITLAAREDWTPDEGAWIALAEYAPDARQILYGVSAVWPPPSRQSIQEGFYASDLTLWAD